MAYTDNCAALYAVALLLFSGVIGEFLGGHLVGNSWFRLICS